MHGFPWVRGGRAGADARAGAGWRWLPQVAGRQTLPPIRVEAKPGTRWNYSGGGFTIVQQMMIDAARTAFPALLRESVLGPVGMTHSTYEQPLPERLRGDAATPYDGKGEPITGGAHTYPEMTAAGLWTTPTDLTKYLVEVQSSLEGKGHVLSEGHDRTDVEGRHGELGPGTADRWELGEPIFLTRGR